MARASISKRCQAGSLAAVRWAALILLATAGSAAADPSSASTPPLAGLMAPSTLLGATLRRRLPPSFTRAAGPITLTFPAQPPP
jgi:hypothetical protein